MSSTVRAVAVLALFSAGIATSLSAQTSRSVEGRVMRPSVAPVRDSTGMSPVAGVMVTLHRVGKDTAGPVDSTRTSADGQYRLTWRPFGASEAVYFASVTWGGIAYFTSPLRDAVNRGPTTEIAVFDTTSRSFPVTVRGRHLVVSAADTTDHRTIVEVFELSNDSVRTLIAAEAKGAPPTWTVAIPSAARSVRASEGEVSPDAFVQVPGRVSITAPLAPGIKQLSFSYRVPTSAFPLRFAIEHGATVLEVLVEEPRGIVSGGGLAPTDPVALEGRNFRRFLAQDVADGKEITIELPAGRSPGRNLYIASLLAAIGVAMLLMLSRAMQRRRPLGLEVPAARVREAPLAERLAREIAELDAVYARQQAPSDAVRLAYDERRAELKDALSAELARAGTTR